MALIAARLVDVPHAIPVTFVTFAGAAIRKPSAGRAFPPATPTGAHPMTNPAEIEAKFWKALKSDRTMMLGLDGVDDGHAQPMTGQTVGDHDRGPIWFFTTKDNTIVHEMREGHRAIAHFTAKGHDLFATIHGNLVIEQDRSMIDTLWNRFVAAWFEGGKDDPKLQLIRLDAERGQIWLDENSLFAGAKMALGLGDPKEDYKDKVAEVSLS